LFRGGQVLDGKPALICLGVIQINQKGEANRETRKNYKLPIINYQLPIIN
jgi:hypothetical protein